MAELVQHLSEEWRNALAPFYDFREFERIQAFLLAEKLAGYRVFPEERNIFMAFNSTPPDAVKAVLLGQDPYHDDGQACGLAFAVPSGVPAPPSLKNILKELADDMKCPTDGLDIRAWSQAGVLMMNTVLTVRAHQAASHRNVGWETFTDAVIRALSARKTPVAFILWGNDARKKEALIDGGVHAVVAGPHPSPLSAYRGFFGSRPFSKVNGELLKRGRSAIQWLPPDFHPAQQDFFL